MTDFDWTYEDLTLLTEDEYKASPFPWGGSTTLVEWKGVDAKRLECPRQSQGFLRQLSMDPS